MIIYLVMLSVSMFFAVYAGRAKPYEQLRSTYWTFSSLSALPFILVSVFRYRVGTDWTFVYEPYMYYINHGINEFSEKGFTLIYRVIGFFTDDAWWAIAFVGLLTMIFFFLAICQQSVMMPFSILLFFITNKYFTSLNQIRQMLAMAIFVYSLKYIFRRNWNAYFFWNLLGATIHTSSYMYLPVYFLYGVRATPRRSITFLTVAILGMPILIKLSTLIARFTRYAWYLDSAFNQNNFYLLGFLVTLFFTLLHVFYLVRFPEQDTEFEFMTNMLVISTVLLLLSVNMSQVLRVSEGLSIVQLFSFPKMLKKENDDRMWIFVWLTIVGIYTVKLWYDVYVNKWYDVLPYHTVFTR